MSKPVPVPDMPGYRFADVGEIGQLACREQMYGHTLFARNSAPYQAKLYDRGDDALIVEWPEDPRLVSTAQESADLLNVKLWDAINRVVETSGGNTGNTSVARQKAVIEVERIVAALRGETAPESPALSDGVDTPPEHHFSKVDGALYDVCHSARAKNRPKPDPRAEGRERDAWLTCTAGVPISRDGKTLLELRNAGHRLTELRLDTHEATTRLGAVAPETVRTLRDALTHRLRELGEEVE